MPQKEQIRGMFDSIAPDYDRLNHILSLGADRSWRKRSVNAVACPDRTRRFLDLACGTGDYSLALARAMHPDSRITGVDISQGMLEIMKRKVLENNLEDKITVINADAASLPFPDSSFNCVTIAFGIRNFQDRGAALREILRVLDKGGQLVILELSMPSNKFLRWIFNLGFKTLAPLIGGRFSGNREAYRYLPESVSAFPGKEEWMAFMRDCGYASVTHRAFSLGICRMYTGSKV